MRLALCLLLALAFASMDSPASAASPSPAPAGMGAADSTGGAGSCATALANFQKVIDADNASGNVSAKVYARITKDLSPVRATCQSGNDAQARAMLAAVRARYGYP